MQTLTIEVNSDKGIKALHTLEEKRLIKIVNESILNTPSLPGKELSLEEFKNWISEAENVPSIPLQEAKLQWANKRNRLQQLAK
jgi:hypothetical protein